jgi:hypothetical protein
MGKYPIAWLGLIPLIYHGVVLYVAYRMPHIRSSFWVWLIGWLAAAASAGHYAYGRIANTVAMVDGRVSLDLTRVVTAHNGAFLFMVFILCMRWIFPSERTLWDDVKADGQRLWTGIQYLTGRGRA